MRSAPMGNFQGPFSNINNCLEHGFPFIYWRIAKLGSHFTVYSCVHRSSQKWGWCYIHARNWSSEGSCSFLTEKTGFSKESLRNCSSRASRVFLFCFVLFCFFWYLIWDWNLIKFFRMRARFYQLLSGDQSKVTYHNTQPYKARYISHCQFINVQMRYSDFLFVSKASPSSYLDIWENEFWINLPIIQQIYIECLQCTVLGIKCNS